MNRSPRNLRGIRIGPPAAALAAAACLIPAGALGWHGLDLRPLFASGDVSDESDQSG